MPWRLVPGSATVCCSGRGHHSEFMKLDTHTYTRMDEHERVSLPNGRSFSGCFPFHYIIGHIYIGL